MAGTTFDCLAGCVVADVWSSSWSHCTARKDPAPLAASRSALLRTGPVGNLGLGSLALGQVGTEDSSQRGAAGSWHSQLENHHCGSLVGPIPLH